MSWWSIISAVSTGAAAFIAIGFVSYTIYETYMREKQHSYKGSKKDDKSKSRTFVEYENIKPQRQNEELRHRNTSKKEIQNGNQSVTGKEVPVFDHGTQTDCPEFTLPNNGSSVLNNDDASSVTSSTTFDGTESTCDSIASTETITSDMDQDLLSDGIPTWSEMSAADRNLILCSACEEEYVSTVTIPCEHPYLCEECAPILLNHYMKCPYCHRHISDYQGIQNL